jgi:hypothetical protein
MKTREAYSEGEKFKEEIGGSEKGASKIAKYTFMALLTTSIMMGRGVTNANAQQTVNKSTTTAEEKVFVLESKNKIRDILVNPYLKEGIGLEIGYEIPVGNENKSKESDAESNYNMETTNINAKGIIKTSILGDVTAAFLTLWPETAYENTTITSGYNGIVYGWNYTEQSNSKDKSITKSVFVPMTLTFPLGPHEIGGGVVFGSREIDGRSTYDSQQSGDIGTIYYQDGSYVKIDDASVHYTGKTNYNDRFIGWTAVINGSWYLIRYTEMKGERYSNYTTAMAINSSGNYYDSSGKNLGRRSFYNELNTDKTSGPEEITRKEWNFSLPIVVYNRNEELFKQMTIVPQYRRMKEIYEAYDYSRKIEEISIDIRQTINNYLSVGLKVSHIKDSFSTPPSESTEGRNTVTGSMNIKF